MTVELPDNVDELLAAFPPLDTAAWHELVAADLNTDRPAEKLEFNTGEGISLRRFYRADDPEAAPIQIPGLPDKTSRCVYLKITSSTSAEDVAYALRTEPRHLILSFDESFRVDEQAEALLAQVADAGVQAHLDARSHSLSAAACWQAADIDLAPSSLLVDLPGMLAAEGSMPDAAPDWMAHIAESIHFAFCADGRYHHETGATIVQELAGMLASATDTVDTLSDHIDPKKIIAQLQFVVPVDRDLLLQTAKLRALRILHHRWTSAYLEDDISPAYILAITSRRSESRCDVNSNILRSTSGMMAAYLGGADLVAVRQHSKQAQNSRLASRLAQNSPIILEEETDIATYGQAAEGSYYLNAATRAFVDAAWNAFLEIEGDGGLIASLQDGTWQSQLAKSRDTLLHEVRTRRDAFVGTSKYAQVDERCETDQTDEVSINGQAANPPDTWNEAVKLAKDGVSLSEHHRAIMAGQKMATCDPIPAIRAPEIFEELRREVQSYLDMRDRPIRIQLIGAGSAPLQTAKFSFAIDYLAAGALPTEEPIRLNEAGDFEASALSSSVDAVIVCANSESTEALLTRLEQYRNDSSQPALVVASSPDDKLKSAGADLFIYTGSDLPETIRELIALLPSN